MRSRFISAVALYGPKSGPVRDFLAGVQATIAAHIGDRFRPYSLDQVHGTLIALDGAPDPATGAVVNEYYRTRTGAARAMDLGRAMDILASHLTPPIPVRLGGYQRHQEFGFTSRGQHLHDRSFSVQDNAFVLVGWPVVSLAGADRPLDALRRDMNAAHVLHRYHVRGTDVDNDLHLVVGHHADAAPSSLERVTDAVRGQLAAAGLEIAIGLDDVKIVAADSPTLAPPLYVSGIPADEATLRALMS
jgi:hypothetical protein